MQKKLQFLESFNARGSDGERYKVCGYEHLARDDTWLTDGREHWESTGKAEYRLADGAPVEVQPDGSLRVASTGVELSIEG